MVDHEFDLAPAHNPNKRYSSELKLACETAFIYLDMSSIRL